MRHILFIWTILTLTVSSLTYATWQVADPNPNDATQSITLNPAVGESNYPYTYWNNKKFLLDLRKGLLYENVKKYAKTHGWRLRWLASRHFPVLTNTTIAGPNFTEVMDRLFEMYPLYVYYDTKTQVMTVSPTKIIQKVQFSK